MLQPSFAIAVERRAGGAAVLSVAGELDLATAGQLRRTVGDLMGMGTRQVTVDLAEVGFIDSTGLGAILWAEHRLQAVGGDLAAVHCCPPVQRAFGLAGLGRLVH